jgi:lysophospholipase L1-like esterase
MIYKNVELYNVEELIAPEDGVGKVLSRIPNKLRMTLNESAKTAALFPAGCEIRFNLEGESAKILLKREEMSHWGSQLSLVEVFQGSFQVSWNLIGTKPTEITLSLPQNVELLDKVSKKERLPFDAHLTRVILPYDETIRLIDIDGRTVPPNQGQTPKKKYLAYGSSITHGAWAIRPTGSYAMKTAQVLGADLINLGFGGGAHCERQIADYIARREDWDLVTLETGINMLGFSTEEFKNRVEYLIEKVAKSHPDKWIFCIDLFTFCDDFNHSSKKQNEFRKIVRNTIEKLNMPKLVHIDGRKILKETSGLTSDLVHPSPIGMEEMAMNLSRFIKKRIGTIKNSQF